VRPLIFGIVVGGWIIMFLCGWGAREMTTKPRIETKEIVRWQTRTVTVASKNESVAKQSNVRTVTRWLRPDGTTARLQLKQTDLTSGATVTTSSATDSRSQVVAQTVPASGFRTARSLRLIYATWDPRAPHRAPLLTGRVLLRVAGPLFVSGHVVVPTWAPKQSSVGASV